MAANPNESLLLECRDLFRDHLLEAVRNTFDGVAESLTAMADKTTDFKIRGRYLDARDLAVKHRDVIEAQFKRRLMSEFQNRLDKGKDRQALAELSLEDLQLVEEDDLNETLSFNDMATTMRRHCEDEMSALDQRAAVLLGKPAIEADDNPFGAKVVSDAFKHACQQVECPVEVRLLFMKSFEKLAMDGIRGTCREVNDLLVSHSILPKIRYGVTKNESKPRPEAAAETAEPAAPAKKEKEAAGPQDMFSMLSEMLGGGMQGMGNAGPGLGVGGAPLVAGQQLMGSLTNLQRGDMSALGAEVAAELAPLLAEAGNMKNVLRQLKATSVGAGMGQMDAMTLEIVSMLFDALFDDPKVPLALKAEIGRLQLPMLKVAIADKELFSSKTHPARRLLDTIGNLGMRLPRDLGADSPVLLQVEKLVGELIEVFQDNVEVFDSTRLQLEAMIAAEDAQIALRMQASQKELEQVESLALAKSQAQDYLRGCVAANPDVPNAVFEFLGKDWIKYLVVVRARDGLESEAWKAATQTTDQMLWSVLPKRTIEDHRALTKAIPPLLRGLKAGIAAGGIEDAVASEFFGQLMKCHTAALRAATSTSVPAPTVAAALARKAAPAPELDFTQNVTLDNPFGGGKVEVSDDDLDFTATVAPTLETPAPAGEAPGAQKTPAKRPRPAQTVRLPAAMVVDAWVTVEDEQARHARPARLHYVSPLKSHFLFVDRQGNKVFECSRTMLARRLKLGEVVLLDGEPDTSLFDRIMDGIFGKLKKPGMQPAQLLAAPA
jgi:hypothetical protein